MDYASALRANCGMAVNFLAEISFVLRPDVIASVPFSDFPGYEL